MKNSVERVVTIVVGAIVLFAAYQFWFGSGIFNGFFESSVESGKLGAGGADFMSQFLEIIFTVLSTVGTVFLAVAFKLIQFIANAFQGTADNFARPSPPPNDVQVHVIDDQDPMGLTAKEPRPVRMNEQQRNDYIRVLLQAISEGDASLTIAMAQRINGSDFLTKREKKTPSQKTQPQTTHFPTSESN